MNTFLVASLFVCSVLWTGLLVWRSWHRLAAMRRAELQIGRVVALRRVETGDGPGFSPDVEFVDRDGECRLLQSSAYASRDHWKIGQDVVVALDPRKPWSPPQLHMPQHHWGMFLAMATGGIFVTGVAGVMLISMLRH